MSDTSAIKSERFNDIFSTIEKMSILQLSEKKINWAFRISDNEDSIPKPLDNLIRK